MAGFSGPCGLPDGPEVVTDGVQRFLGQPARDLST